jgi:hypothetical protein
MVCLHTSLHVAYTVNEDGSSFLLILRPSPRLSDFLKSVRERQATPDRCSVFVDGVLLGNDDGAEKWSRNHVVVRVASSHEPGRPEDRWQIHVSASSELFHVPRSWTMAQERILAEAS